MLFTEFKEKYGKYQAFAGWVTIEDAKACGMIPQAYNNVFENLCECGSENIIAPNLKRLTCCDPNCYIKVGYQLAEMFSRAGFVGLGYASCSNVYKALRQYDESRKKAGYSGLFKTNSYTEVLLVPWEDYPPDVSATAAGLNFYQACHLVCNTVKTFSQLVGSLGLTGLGSNSDKIFSGIDSLDEWIATVNSAGGLIPFCTQRGVTSYDIIFDIACGAEAIGVASIACSDVIRKRGIIPLDVCITGRVVVDGEKMTKDAFIQRCNAMCVDANGVQLLEIKNTSGPATAPFVLYTTQSGSAKYNAGKRRGNIYDEFGRHPVLVTVSEFYHWLKEGIESWNQIEKKDGTNFLTVMMNSSEKMWQLSIASQQTQETEVQEVKSFS